MKKLVSIFSIAVALTSCAVQAEYTRTDPQIVDVVVEKGLSRTIFRNVTLMDAQDEFCVFIENGNPRTQLAPYEIVKK